MFRWLFVVLAFVAMMVYGGVVFAEEAQPAAPAAETAVEKVVPATAPAEVTEAVPAAEKTAPAPADTATTDEAPVMGGSSCGSCEK